MTFQVTISASDAPSLRLAALALAASFSTDEGKTLAGATVTGKAPVPGAKPSGTATAGGQKTATGALSGNEATRIAGSTAVVSAASKTKPKPAPEPEPEAEEAAADALDEEQQEEDALGDGDGDGEATEAYTLDDVRAVLLEVKEALAHRQNAINEVLATVGATKLVKVAESDYPALVAAAKAAMVKYAKKK